MKTTWGVAFFSLVGISSAAYAQDGGELGGEMGGEITDDESTEEESTEEESMDSSPTTTSEAPVADVEPAAPSGSLSPSISGFVDGTYNYSLMDPAGGNLFHAYTFNDNTFALNLAHLSIAGSDNTVAYAVELDAGSDAALNYAFGTGLPPGALPAYFFDLQEAWVSYASEGGIGFKLGKFVTYNGIEVIENTANPTITRGYLFGLAEPVGHVGGVVTYKLNDEMDVAAGLVNGWDVAIDNNSLRTFVGKFGYNTDTMGLTASTYIGPEQAGNNDDFRMTFDATAVLKMDKIDLWLQGNLGRESFGDGAASGLWFGLGVQPVYKVDDKMSIGARAELFVDTVSDPGVPTRTGIAIAPDGNGPTLINLTGAPAYKLTDNLTLRGELRLDIATEDVFPSKRGPESMNAVIATEVLYTFGM